MNTNNAIWIEKGGGKGRGVNIVYQKNLKINV